jgi:hypothetical protein
VTLLAGRALVDEHALPDHVVRRYYDEETIRGDDSLAKRTRDAVESWWPARDAEPDLMVEGIWLPDVMSVGKALLIRLEVMEYVSIVERVLNDAKPDRIVLVTGASTVERVARAIASERGIRRASARGLCPRDCWPSASAGCVIAKSIGRSISSSITDVNRWPRPGRAICSRSHTRATS